ncbi:MAG: hypothetical protein WCT07_04580 [Candidatus Paceibacterota bacterium]
MKNFFREKTMGVKVNVQYIPETRKKIKDRIVLRTPGNLSVWIITTTKPLFRRHVEKYVLLGWVDTVWGYEIFFQETAKITEKMNKLAPWANGFFEETLRGIKEKPEEEFNVKKEKTN